MTNSKWTRDFFTPVAVVLLFNVTDLCGRISATYLQWPKRTAVGRYGFLIVCLLRTALIPLFMFCNARPETRKMSIYIHSDGIFCSLLAILAFSAGYLGNHALTNAPKTSEDSSSQEATSLILTALFVLGQASGSFLSYFVLGAL